MNMIGMVAKTLIEKNKDLQQQVDEKAEEITF